MTERVQLNDEQVEGVVGGNFNWFKKNGKRLCWVNEIGTYECTVDAKDTFAWLKVQHKGEGWSEQDYVDALLASGDFTPYV